MKTQNLLIIILGILPAIAAILYIIESPSIAPLVGASKLEVTLSTGILSIIIAASIGVGAIVFLLNNHSKTEPYFPRQIYMILAELRRNHGEGFDTNDAIVVEAYQKGKGTMEDIAIFTNLSEKEVQKIMDKLAERGVNGFGFE